MTNAPNCHGGFSISSLKGGFAIHTKSVDSSREQDAEESHGSRMWLSRAPNISNLSCLLVIDSPIVHASLGSLTSIKTS